MSNDMDAFAQFVSNEASVGRISRARETKIIAAIDLVENAMEELQW